MAERAQAPQDGELTDEQIVGQFESLGDNCEFGLVQRAVGVERLGFFRFNWATLPALVQALDRDFGDVDRPELVEIYAEPNDELMVRIKNYMFQYHTHLYRGSVDLDVLRAQQVKAIRFLARKLLEDLRSGEKIFVRKGVDSASGEQIAPLLRALRRHGPATLLWVVPQDEAHSLGSVEVVEPGLLKGYVDRFAPYDMAGDFSAVWLDVCRGAHRLWRERHPAGTVLAGFARRAASNLVRHADSFGGKAWWHAPHAAAALSGAVARRHADCAVTEHRLLAATDNRTAAIHGCSVAQAISPGSVYVASIFVWLPADFSGTHVGAVFNGFASIHMANARTALRGAWQRVWVSARVPAGTTNASPSLHVLGPAGTRLFSTCWKLEMGTQPTEYEPAEPPAPDLAMQPLAGPPTRRYRTVTLQSLAAEPAASMEGGKAAECVSSLPASVLDVPALAFGDTRAPQADAGALRLQRAAMPVYLLRNVLLHGQHGVITSGDRAISESLQNFPFHLVAGAAKESEDAVRLAELPLSATVHSAYHLLLCNSRNYFHWMNDAMTRFRPTEYAAFGAHPETAGAPVALVPTLDVFWKWESLALLVPNTLPRIALASEGRVFVQRLLYVPDLSGRTFHPHPALLDAFDAIRARVMAGEPARPPWRRLYISRSDSRNRVLANEAEVAERAERAGFTVVTLSKHSVWEQVRLFAEASHILAPHGAGLVNIGFCQPGAVLCELQMDRYVHWAFRRLAALRGVRYGCLVGGTVGPDDAPIHASAWRLDGAALDAVLADPRFVGG